MSSIPRTKYDLEQAIDNIFPRLMADYRSIPAKLTRTPGIEGNRTGRHISVCDTVAYLLGWGKLVLKWYWKREQGEPVDFPESGHKWNQLGRLAEGFYLEYSEWNYNELLDEFDQTIREMTSLITSLNDEELYGIAWYKEWTLGRMIQLNTVSPMKNMRKKVRRFKRQVEEGITLIY